MVISTTDFYKTLFLLGLKSLSYTMNDNYECALTTVKSGIIVDALQIFSKALINTLIHDIKFFYDIFYAGWSSPAGILLAIYTKGLVFLLKGFSLFKLKMGYEYSVSSTGGAGSPPPPGTGRKGPTFGYNSKISSIKPRTTVSLLAAKELSPTTHLVHNPPTIITTPHVTAKNQPILIPVPLSLLKRNNYSRATVAIRNIGLCFALVIMAPESLKTAVKPSKIVPYMFSKTQALISFILLKLEKSKSDAPIGTSLSATRDKENLLVLKQDKDVSKGCTFLKNIVRKFL
jgi:hypothetical protein